MENPSRNGAVTHISEYSKVFSTASGASLDQEFPFGRNQILQNIMISLKTDSPLHVSVEFKYTDGTNTYYIGLFDGWINAGQAGSYQGVVAGGFIGPSDYSASIRIKVSNNTDGAIEWHLFYRYQAYQNEIVSPYVTGLDKVAHWLFAGSVAQVVAVPSPIGIDITVAAGQTFKPLYYVIGPDDYAAGRTINLVITDGTSNVCFLETASVDNQVLYGPTQKTYDADTSSTLAALGASLESTLYSDFKLRLSGTSLANTETITFIIVAEVSDVPTVAARGTGITLTTTRNEIV